MSTEAGRMPFHINRKRQFGITGPRNPRHTRKGPKAALVITRRELMSPVLVMTDSILIIALALISGVAHEQFILGTSLDYLIYTAAGVVIAVVTAIVFRLLASRHTADITDHYERFWEALLAWSLAFGALCFLVLMLEAGGYYPRDLVLTFFVAGAFVFTPWRSFALPYTLRMARAFGQSDRECIVIGDKQEDQVDQFVQDFANFGLPCPVQVRFTATCDNVTWAVESRKIINRVVRAALSLKPGEIYICSRGLTPDRVATIQRGLMVLPRAIYIVPDPNTDALLRCRTSHVGKHLAVEVSREPLGPFQRFAKRMIDIVFALFGIVLLLPLFLVVAVAIKIDTSGPVFFRQNRNGYRGKQFKIFKFRSMGVMEDGANVRQASKGDPRVTRVGGFLRKSSIDELPQLLNVLFGEMSLVGPRPHALAHDEMYAKAIENYEVRQHVKPGITGWAQVNGLRGETATLDLMYRRIEYDQWYAVNASLLLDCVILARTVFEVARQRNAY